MHLMQRFEQECSLESMEAIFNFDEGVSFNSKIHFEGFDEALTIVEFFLKKGLIDHVRMLLASNKMQVDRDTQYTILHRAIKQKNLNLVAVIMEFCPCLAYRQDARGASPLHKIAKKGLPVEYAKTILEAPNLAKVYLVNMRDKGGNTPLIWASLNGDSELAHLLLQYGAIPDAPNGKGYTPHTYCKWSTPKLSRTLTEAALPSLFTLAARNVKDIDSLSEIAELSLRTKKALLNHHLQKKLANNLQIR